MSTNRSRSAAFRAVALAIIALAVTHPIALTGALDRANARTFDWLMQMRNRMDARRGASDDRVVHIDIDDASIAALGGRRPDRQHVAQVMRTVAAAGAALQAYDFVFAGAQDGDAALVEAARGSTNVYVGTAADYGRGSAVEGPRVNPAAPWQIRVQGRDLSTPSVSGWMTPFQGLTQAARGAGALNAAPDADGVFRRVPLVLRDDAGYYPSLSLAVACGYLGVPPDQITLHPGRSLVLHGARAPGREPRDLVIPIDAAGAMTVNFDGDWSAHPHFAFADVWRDGMDPTALPLWQAAVGGRIVIVGDVSTGEGDVGAVPVDAMYPLPGLHATAIRNIVAGSFLSTAPWWSLWFVKGVLAALIVLIAVRWPRWLWPMALVMTMATVACLSALFIGAGLIVNLVQPLVAVALITGMVATSRYLAESRAREPTRRAFESYFPPAVVARLLTEGRSVAGSRRKEVTVLFSDIVGFTSRSARMSPEAVQTFLNDYFSRMVSTVFRHGGTVDKFIGDGLMVFFNDPEHQPDHAERAIRCALALQQEAAAMSSELVARGERPLLVRIGVHTGSAFVGDLGSAERLSYTAVGPAVNLAQRLESIAPAGGIVMSADTAARLPADMPITSLGDAALKGFDEPVTIFTADKGPAEIPV